MGLEAVQIRSSRPLNHFPDARHDRMAKKEMSPIERKFRRSYCKDKGKCSKMEGALISDDVTVAMAFSDKLEKGNSIIKDADWSPINIGDKKLVKKLKDGKYSDPPELDENLILFTDDLGQTFGSGLNDFATNVTKLKRGLFVMGKDVEAHQDRINGTIRLKKGRKRLYIAPRFREDVNEQAMVVPSISKGVYSSQKKILFKTKKKNRRMK